MMWLRNQRWLLPFGTLLTLVAACAAGAIPILLAPTAGWRWVAVFASPTLGFITVVVVMEFVHRTRRALIAAELLPDEPMPPAVVHEEERVLIQAINDPGDPDLSSLGAGRQSALGARP